jgi:hypothetical protein
MVGAFLNYTTHTPTHVRAHTPTCKRPDEECTKEKQCNTNCTHLDHGSACTATKLGEGSNVVLHRRNMGSSLKEYIKQNSNFVFLPCTLDLLESEATRWQTENRR